MRQFRPYPVIAGPTASGKTAVSIELAKRLHGEVVSADSMQIYADISVGTARPTDEEMQGITHHLIGFLPLEESYSVARYVDDANGIFESLFGRGITPVLCGGTGLYIQSFVENVQFFSQEPNPGLRSALKEKATIVGGAAMLEELRLVDPQTADRLHQNDLNRIIRALEVYYTTGNTISEQARLSKSEPSAYDACIFLLNFHDRSTLYERIERRVDLMLRNGLLDEARRVMNTAPGATVLQAIGYKELLPYLTGDCSLDDAIEQLKTSTRHYAKRQLSWFHRMSNIRTVWMDDFADINSVVNEIESQFNAFKKEGKSDAEGSKKE